MARTREVDTDLEAVLRVGTLAPAPSSRVRHLAQALLALIVLAALGGGVTLAGSLSAASAHIPFTGPGTGSVLVRIAPGDSLTVVAHTLEQGGVVASADSFALLAAADPRAARLAPGSYTLHRSMGDRDALALLLDPHARLSLRVTIPEGFTLAQTLARISQVTHMPLPALQAAAADRQNLHLPPAATSVEGYLFPATYDVDPTTTPAALLAQMLARYDTESTSLALEARARDLNLTPAQVVTVASLVQAETSVESDMPKVARVVYNRLATGMPLQFDSSINYVIPVRKGRLSDKDLRLDSPYNTYLHKGLPPTPVGSPGRAALAAALSPAPGPYRYFVITSKKGDSLFTADYQEFLRAKDRAQKTGLY